MLQSGFINENEKDSEINQVPDSMSGTAPGKLFIISSLEPERPSSVEIKI